MDSGWSNNRWSRCMSGTWRIDNLPTESGAEGAAGGGVATASPFLVIPGQQPMLRMRGWSNMFKSFRLKCQRTDPGGQGFWALVRQICAGQIFKTLHIFFICEHFLALKKSKVYSFSYIFRLFTKISFLGYLCIIFWILGFFRPKFKIAAKNTFYGYWEHF